MPVCPLSSIILRSCRLSSRSFRTGPGSGGVDAHAILSFTLRTNPKIKRAYMPLHGVILLVGSPGTGKTSLAQGLASRTADVVSECLYLEVEPHALTSGTL